MNNIDFIKSIERLRSILPKLSFGLLIATYFISAIIMGIFHSQNAPDIGFMIAAFLVPLAIQAGRGTLVFFFQLNPAQIQGRYSFGIIAATGLLILSLIEACLVLFPFGYSWIISVSTLMLIGWVIEIMILKETIFVSQMQLFQNKEDWKKIKEFYIAQTELKRFLKELHSGEVPSLPEPNHDSNIKLKEPAGEENKALELIAELNNHLQGKVSSPSRNGVEEGKH